MFPSSNRFKLNRDAFKDAAGHPSLNIRRRRRISKSQSHVLSEPKEEKYFSCMAGDTSSVPNGQEPEPVLSSETRRVDRDCVNNGERENCRGGMSQPQPGRGAHESRGRGKSNPKRVNSGDHETSPQIPSGPERRLRVSVPASCCDLCKETKYVSPQRKSLKNKEDNCGNSEPERPALELKTNKAHPTTKITNKLSIWIDQYAKVTLCDIARKCNVCNLPDAQKNKVVHCYKQDMTDVKKNNGPRCDRIRGEISKNQRKRLRYDATDGDLPSTPGAESSSCNDMARTQLIHEDTACCGLSADSQSCDKLMCGSGTTHTAAKAFSQIDGPRETDAAQVPSKRLCTDESFTCQRVRVYSRKMHFSCARTSMPWPFSNSIRTLIADTNRTGCQAESIHLAVRNNSDSTVNMTHSGLHRIWTKYPNPSRPREPSPDTSHQVLRQSEENPKKDRMHIVANHIQKPPGSLSSHSTDSSTMDSVPHSTNADELFVAFRADTVRHSIPSRHGIELGTNTVPNACTSVNGMETGSSISWLTDWEATPTMSPTSVSFSPTSPKPFRATVGKPLLFPEETQKMSCSPSTSCCDSFGSSESSLLLPQDGQELNNAEEAVTERTLPTLEPYYNEIPRCQKQTFGFGDSREQSPETNSDEFLLPPLLSPVTSPHGCGSTLLQRQGCCDRRDERKNDDNTTEHKTVLVPHDSGGQQNEMEGVSPKSIDCFREPSQDMNNNEENMGQNDRHLSEPCPSPSSDEGSHPPDGSSPSETLDDEMDETDMAAAGAVESSNLDEFSAYEQDILLLDVMDDPELFENVPEESLPKLGPTRFGGAPRTKPTGVVMAPSLRSKPVVVNFHDDGPHNTEDSDGQHPQCSSNLSPIPTSVWAWDFKIASLIVALNQAPFDVNNNDDTFMEVDLPIQPGDLSTVKSFTNGPRTTNPPNMNECRPMKIFSKPDYCRYYFSESLSCGHSVCRYQHVPVDGDEKLCVETVERFIKNPMCLYRAGAIFIGYYQRNPPGAFFSKSVFVSLLWGLLKGNMLADVLSVLHVGLDLKIAPGHDFLLELFNFVREKSLMGFAPQIVQLVLKMASEGLVLSLDWLACMKNTPEFQQVIGPNPTLSISVNAATPEQSNMAHLIVEVELCTKQEDWARMGKVFGSISRSSHHPSQVEQISGRIAIALLSESKDKMSLPFATFAETVCQTEGEDKLIRGFLGRIGVSLMLRYHKTHQWAKGRRVVEVLSVSKVAYSMLMGLFGNEDRASRCCLITVATELFLLSGSVEGALNTLRDVHSRIHVLTRLAEKTAHRDTLEVLSNLPGIKEPNDLADTSRYSPLFNSHLQVCMERQILTLASDTVDFMLSKNLPVDQVMLKMLFHKLGKLNMWLRAREIFRHSLSMGYYSGVSAPPGLMAGIVPCGLGEVELALTFEMFITVNASAIFQPSETTTSSLSITLNRTQSSESEYLLAASRLLSAASITHPKLTVQYTGVNSLQEQVFTLDVASAQRWLRQNHLWANEVWTH